MGASVVAVMFLIPMSNNNNGLYHSLLLFYCLVMKRVRRFLRKVFRRSPRPDTRPGAILNTGASPSAPVIATTGPSAEELPATSPQKKASHREFASAPTGCIGDNPPDAHGSVAIQQTSSQITQGLTRSSLDGIRVPSSAVNINQATLSSDSRHGGMFQNAQRFSINQPIMGEHVEIHYNHHSNALKEMRDYIIRGAEFDSSDRDDPPRCHPGTRTRFLELLQEHIHDTTLGTRIIWLCGPAGVGKSAIMQTLAEIESPRSTCTTLFFSRPNKRDDPKKVFPTLAHGLAVVNSQYRDYLGDKLNADPGFLEKVFEEQFKRLFITPFINNHIGTDSRRWVILLDGLDECNGEKEQCRILDSIRDSIVHHATSTPFIWIIASRPEAHLKACFTEVEARLRGFWKLEVPIDSTEASKSVEIYLRAEFAKIQRNFADFIPPSWPSEHDFLKIAASSSGLFVLSSTLIGYISEDDPVSRLEHIISCLGKPGADSSDVRTENPFEALDTLYRHIMSTLSPNSLQVAKAILGSLFLKNAIEIDAGSNITSLPTLSEICNILALRPNMAYAVLRKLHSVLSVPSYKEAQTQRVKFLHASFSDFLRDKSRSGTYYIDLDQELRNIWQCFVRIAKQSQAPSKWLPPRSIKHAYLQCLGHITLSWKPEEPIVTARLQRDLGQTAHKKWLGLLVDYCHECTSCQETSKYCLSLSTSELIGVFEELDFIPALSMVGYTVERFHDWLVKGHAPSSLRQRILFKESDLGSLTEDDFDNMFRGLSLARWGWCKSCGLGSLRKIELMGISASKWDQVKQCARTDERLSWGTEFIYWSVLGELLRINETADAQVSKAIRVAIIGMKPSEYCAFIGPLEKHSAFVEKGVEYLVIPYVESTREQHSGIGGGVI